MTEPRCRAVLAAAKMMQHLYPGSLAELRRMEKETGTPVFWRLAARHPGAVGRQDMEGRWMEIIRILAILTPKGDPAGRPPLHNSRRRLGEVLCDGGDPNWTGPRPAFSQLRMAQLMAARGTQRGVLLTRAARALARSRGAEKRSRCRRYRSGSAGARARAAAGRTVLPPPGPG